MTATEALQKMGLEVATSVSIPETNKVKAGDLFYTSWGYDQTNYDFLVVLSISKTGKTCKCRMTAPEYKGHSGCSDLLQPKNEPYGEVFTMRIQDWNNAPYLRGSYPFLHTGEGSKRLDGFFPADPDRNYHQTDAYSGH